ncbi:MAG: TRAP transporter small permease [Mangrovicoccus sp.]
MTQSSKHFEGAGFARALTTWVETAAALLMGLVTLLVFVSAIMRYLASSPIPDAHDLGRLSLGIAIFWGVATVNLSGTHISVDLLYQIAGKRGRQLMDLFSTGLTLVAFAVLTVKMSENAADVFRTGEYSYDLRLPIWPAYWMMVAGSAFATLTLALRLWMVLTGTLPDEDTETPVIEE